MRWSSGKSKGMGYMRSIKPTPIRRRMDHTSTFTKAFFLKITKMVWECSGTIIGSISDSSLTTLTSHILRPCFCIAMEICILAQCSITKEMEEECSSNQRPSSTNTIDMRLRRDMMIMKVLWLGIGKMIS